VGGKRKRCPRFVSLLQSASRPPRHPASAPRLKALVSEYRNSVSIAARSSRPLVTTAHVLFPYFSTFLFSCVSPKSLFYVSSIKPYRISLSSHQVALVLVC
jgi:hypothetical protein